MRVCDRCLGQMLRYPYPNDKRRCVQCGYTIQPQPIIEGTLDPKRTRKAKYE